MRKKLGLSGKLVLMILFSALASAVFLVGMQVVLNKALWLYFDQPETQQRAVEKQVHRLSAITWFLAKHLVRVEYAGLPNILLHKEVTPELLQDKVTAGNIAEVVLPWLTDEVKRQENIRELKSVRAVLGEGGAVRRTAELILRTAEGK